VGRDRAEAAQTRDDFTVYSLLDSMDWMPSSMVTGLSAAEQHDEVQYTQTMKTRQR